MPAREGRRSTSRGRRSRASAGSNPVLRWLGNPLIAGGIWILAGVLCLVVVGLEPLGLLDVTEWMYPRSVPQSARAIAILVILGVGGLLSRLLLGRPSELRMNEGAHQVGEKEEEWRDERRRGGLIGALLVGLGFLLVAGSWIAGHQNEPTGTLLLPVNQAQESYAVEQGARTVNVMLPLRMTLKSVELGEEPRAMVMFARPTREAAPQEFVPGRSLDVEGLRFVFVGFAKGEGAKRAVLRSNEENTIEASGVIGNSVRFDLEGGGYAITAVEENYQGMLGPAVQLERENGERFWVFQREVQNDPAWGHPIELERVERIPAAVMKVSPVRSTWPLGLGVVLFLLGAALMVFGPDERREVVDGVGYRFSLNRRADIGASRPVGRSILLSALVWLVALGAGLLALGATLELGGFVSVGGIGLLVPGVLFGMMGGLLFLSGMRAEGKFSGLTPAVSVVALMGTMVVMGRVRGASAGEWYGVPVWAGGEPVYWHIPGAESLADMRFFAVTGASEFVLYAAIGLLGALLALVGGWSQRDGLRKAGWAIVGVGGVAGWVRAMSGWQVEWLEGDLYERLALPFLQARQLPQQVAAQGVFSVDEGWSVASGALAMEVVAFALVAMIGAAMFVGAIGGSSADEVVAEGPLGGRDLFVYAVVIGGLGWVSGLVGSLGRVGTGGTLAPMEWLGLAVILVGVGVLVAGWRAKPGLQSVVRLIGAPMVLSLLVVVLLVGLSGGMFPGTALPFFP